MNVRKTVLIVANLLWFAAIFVLLVLPNDTFPSGLKVPNLDKAVHFVLFGIMAFLLSMLTSSMTSLPHRVICVITFLAATLFGSVMEIVQSQFFNRTGSIYDLLADAAGAMLACLFFPLLHKLANKICQPFLRKKKL